MKVLFDYNYPFLLAHGGFQIQIEQTKAGLESVGVETEFLRWWDDKQQGDLIHYFGRPVSGYIEMAHRKNIRVVLAELLTGLGSRSRSSRMVQKLGIEAASRFLPKMFTARMGWETYRAADGCIANTEWEKYLMTSMFSAPPDRVFCVANGVEQVFLQSTPVPRGPWLICTATITERKRPLELAEAAIRAETPLWIIGKPYGERDEYALRFMELAKSHPKWIRYEGGISDRAQLAQAYRAARGFVLLSTMETLSLSSFEAAACEAPLLLSDLPWARYTFREKATYCPVPASVAVTSRTLRAFYDAAPQLPPPPKPLTWSEIGGQFKSVYETVLKSSR